MLGGAVEAEKGNSMAITFGFGTTMDLERGTARQWVMGRDGVKRWADTNEPVAPTAMECICGAMHGAGATHWTCQKHGCMEVD